MEKLDLERLGKSNKQDTKSESTYKEQNQKLRGRMKKIEKDNKRLRRELQKYKNISDSVSFIIEEEQKQEFNMPVIEYTKKCPKCYHLLNNFTIPHPTEGTAMFEKCDECGYRKKLQKSA